jgi:hypothetical protein
MNLMISLSPKTTKFKKDFSKNLIHFQSFIKSHLNVSSKSQCLNKAWQLRKNTILTEREQESKEQLSLVSKTKLTKSLSSSNLHLRTITLLVIYLTLEVHHNHRLQTIQLNLNHLSSLEALRIS